MNEKIADKKSIKNNKRLLRAEGFLLLPSALRPRLLGVFIKHKLMFPLSLVSSIILSSIIFQNLCSVNVSATSLTLTIPSSTLRLDIAPNDSFTKSSAGTVSVKTDAFSGYTLTIKAKDSSDLVNGSSKISSITNTLSEEQYKAAGNSNTWGYQPSKFNNDNNSNFLPSPTTMPSTIEKTNIANSTNANSYSIVLGAKVNTTIPTGLYSNVFILSATANTVSYSITYNLNQGTWNGKSPQTGTTTESTVKLDNNVPTREGYEFKGWCTRETADENCSGDTYGAGQDYTLTNGDNIVDLWAMWNITYDQGTMQGWTGCEELENNKILNLRDARDENTYNIAKLSDGRCWMIQNLRIQDKLISKQDSDLKDGSFIIPSSDLNRFKISTNDASDYYVNNNAVYITSSNGYYTWYAATAGTGTFEILSGEAQGSICPKNWHLPTISELSTMQSFYNNYDKLVATPIPNFTRHGYVFFDGTTIYGHAGLYWSSTSGEALSALYMDFLPKGWGMGVASYNKNLGFSMRCIFNS